MGRAINYYDGPKPPRNLKNWKALRDLIPDFHQCLYEIASKHEINLNEAVDSKLEKTQSMNKDRFKRKFDPSTSPVLEAFQTCIENTNCPFAPEAQLWGSPGWNPSRSFENNVCSIIESLVMFSKAATYERLDGYVIAFGDRDATSNFLELSFGFANLLFLLSRFDPNDNHCLEGNIEVKGWQFQFCGIRMFVSVHSPLYAKDHIRFNKSGTFVMLQPDISFDYHGIGSKYRHSGRIKTLVRKEFQDQKYPTKLVDDRIEAYLYVLSELETDELSYIRWWHHLDILRDS